MATGISIFLQILALVVFIAIIWPSIKKENWKEKFIENKQAKSVLIIFVLILIFTLGVSTFFDVFFPIERLDQ